MRGGFDKLMSIRYGSRSVTGPPGVTFLSGVPCRKVEQREISQRQFDFTFTDHWVTLDAVELTGPFTSSPWLGAIFTDQLAADEVSFDVDPGVWYTTCRGERVTPFGDVPYWRSLLLPLTLVTPDLWPPPTSPPPPPSPPAPPLTAPGPNCSVGTDLTSFGDYTLGSETGYFIGWYEFLITDSGPIRFELVEPIAPDTRVSVAFKPGGSSDCCGDLVWFDLEAEGSHCQTFYVSFPGHYDREYCLKVQSTSGSGPASTLVRIASGGC